MSKITFIFMLVCWGFWTIAHTANLIHRGIYARARRNAIRESVDDLRRREMDRFF